MAPERSNVPARENGRSVTLTPDLRVQVSDNLWLESVEIGILREQEVNAHTMAPAMFTRLTENIRNAQQMESVPYCAQPNGEGPIEIVSGHHRIRAARAAGFTHVVVLVDRGPLTRSQIVAKQLAHNALVGLDDPDMLQRLVGMITSVDDLLATGLEQRFLPTAEAYKVTLFTPHADYKWKFCTFAFLPHQFADAQELTKALNVKTEGLFVAEEDQFEAFVAHVAEFARKKEILSAGTAVALLIAMARQELGRMTRADIVQAMEASRDGTSPELIASMEAASAS